MGVIPEFFTDRQYDNAASVYSCGTGLGIVMLPILTQAFLDTYGWRGSLLLISGLCLQIIPVAALVLKPRNPRYKPMLLLQSDRSDYERSDLITPSSGLASNPNAGLMENIAVNVGLHLLIRPTFILRVLIPAFAWGYTLSGWMIYIVSFGVSHGATLNESTIVATCGGVGMVLATIPLLPILHMAMTNKQLIYIVSVLSTVALLLTTKFVSFVGMTAFAVVFGVGLGILGTELYIAANNAVEKDEQFLSVAWLHMSYGIASILSGFLSGEAKWK